MQNNNLKRAHPNKKSKTVGRGGTRGKTAGRGTKGQNARAGHKKRPEIRDFIKRIPKLRGRGKNSNMSIQSKVFAINLVDISKAYKAGETVSLATLREKGLVSKTAQFKVLGTGTLDKKLSFEKCTMSKSAKEAIEKAGGTMV